MAPKVDKKSQAAKWDQLAPPPRRLTTKAEARIARTQRKVTNLVVYLAWIACVLIGVYLLLGIGSSNVVTRIAGFLLLLAGIWGNQNTSKIKKRTNAPNLDLYVHGELQRATIQQVFDRTSGSYRPFTEILDQWNELPRGFSSMFGMSRMLKNWPVQLSLRAANTHHDSFATDGKRVETKVDIRRWLHEPNLPPEIHLLVPPSGDLGKSILLENHSWLVVDEAGNLDLKETSTGEEDQSSDLWISLCRALLVVVPTYGLAAYGVLSNRSPELTSANQNIPSIVGALFILLFTLTHGVVPVFFYRLFFSGIEETKKSSSDQNTVTLMVHAFATLHMTIWYGAPIIALAAMTNWYSLGWITLHVILAGKRYRRWSYLEHGSTSMALALFLTVFSEHNLFPTGIIVVMLQAALLTLVEWKGKELWVTPEMAKS